MTISDCTDTITLLFDNPKDDYRKIQRLQHALERLATYLVIPQRDAEECKKQEAIKAKKTKKAKEKK